MKWLFCYTILAKVNKGANNDLHVSNQQSNEMDSIVYIINSDYTIVFDNVI